MKILSALFLVAHICVSGQTPVEWKSGSVVLSNRDVVVGDIYYQPRFETIVVRSEENTLVLPASRLQSFRFYDARENINRQYITITPEHQESRIYEVVLNGDIQIVRSSKPWKSFAPDHEVIDYNYFIWDGGRIEPIGKFRSTYYRGLKKDAMLRAYVREHKLNPDEMRSVLLIVTEYNRLTRRQISLAGGR